MPTRGMGPAGCIFEGKLRNDYREQDVFAAAVPIEGIRSEPERCDLIRKMPLGLPILLAVTLALQASPSSAAEAGRCPPVDVFPNGLKVVRVIRVIKGADGESSFAQMSLAAAQHAYFKPGEMFAAFDFKDAKRVQIVSGPPDVDLPYHASLAYEMFLTIQGNSTVILPNGQRELIEPGTLVVMEDMGSKTGHAGRTGPCGYVAIQIVPSTPLPQ